MHSYNNNHKKRASSNKTTTTTTKKKKKKRRSTKRTRKISIKKNLYFFINSWFISVKERKKEKRNQINKLNLPYLGSYIFI